MINIAICDDDREVVEELENLITTILKNQVKISEHSNPFSLITYVEDESGGRVDLIFMDIHLEGHNGIQVAESIISKYTSIKIIFMTKTIECAQDIFRINPIYFILKPFNHVYVRDALYKAVKIINEEKKDTLKIVNGAGKNKMVSLPIRDIYYVESTLRKVIIHTENDEKEFYSRLDDIEKDLGKGFCRIHQSYIVNLDKIKKVEKSYVVMYNNAMIPISRSKKRETIERIENYIKLLK